MLAAALALPRAMPEAIASRSRSEAERAFVLRHHGFVTRALWSRACPRGALDDAVQQVFLVALKERTEIRDERAFLFGIAVRVAREMIRAAQRHAPPSQPMEDDVRASSDPHPEQLLEKKRAQALLEQALDTLPEDARAVFVLYEIEELTLKEISDLTELPQGTVASRLRRGRELFRDAAKRIRAQLDRPRGVS